MRDIRIAIVGIGNCASSLIQGLSYYKQLKTKDTSGLMYSKIGGYRVEDIRVVAAFDVDARKVGRDVSEAISASPNIAYKYPDVEVPKLGVTVMMGPVLDGVPSHLAEFVEVSDKKPVDIANVLKSVKAHILLNFLPTGSEKAARFYANEAIERAQVGFINGMPTLIVSTEEYRKKAEKYGVPLIGDDIKSQLGATIIHRALIRLFRERGIKIKKSYQLNFAGNTDFYNLVRRGKSKKKTKTEALTSMIPYKAEISTGFSYIKLMRDRKTAIFYIEGSNFGNAPLKFEAKLEVEDSPNFAGVVIDAIRYCKLAQDRRISGALISASAYLMKHPPQQFPDDKARKMLEEFVEGKRER